MEPVPVVWFKCAKLLRVEAEPATPIQGWREAEVEEEDEEEEEGCPGKLKEL